MASRLWLDPWQHRMVPHAEYDQSIVRQVHLARTWRYKARRLKQYLLRQPMLPTANYLRLKRESVQRLAGCQADRLV